MGNPSPAIEAFRRRLRREVYALVAQLKDTHERAMLWAWAATTLYGKVVEHLPEMNPEDESEVRELMRETGEQLRSALETLREDAADAGPWGPSLGPSLN